MIQKLFMYDLEDISESFSFTICLWIISWTKTFPSFMEKTFRDS